MYKRIEGSMVNVNHITRVYGEIKGIEKVKDWNQDSLNLKYQILVELSSGEVLETDILEYDFLDQDLVDYFVNESNLEYVKICIKDFLDKAIENYIQTHIEGER